MWKELYSMTKWELFQVWKTLQYLEINHYNQYNPTYQKAKGETIILAYQLHQKIRT